MKTLIRIYRTKPRSACLAAALLAFSIFSGPAQAMFVPAAPHQEQTGQAAEPGERAADLAKVQAVLESQIIRQKLMDYGLSPEESMARVSRLSDGQIHQLATHVESLQAGGGSNVSLVVVLLIVLLIVLIV